MMNLTTPSLSEICDSVGKHIKLVKGCYVFGSRVYGTADEYSDWDIILIANAPSPEVEYKVGNLNVHIVVPDKFKDWVRVNHIKAIECLFAPEWARIKPFECEFIYKEDSFRHNISHTVSNSWVKAKKKIENGDHYIGIKSLFHSLRIAKFGEQFSREGRIDFGSMNHVWREIIFRDVDEEWEWSELKEKYQPLRNSLLTEFRQVAKVK